MKKFPYPGQHDNKLGSHPESTPHNGIVVHRKTHAQGHSGAMTSLRSTAPAMSELCNGWVEVRFE